MKTKDRILVLDGQTNQALACVRSLGKVGYEVKVASHERMSLGAWSRYCSGSFHLEGQTVEAFADLREWAVREGVTIALPLTERSCVLCNIDRAEWEKAGITLGCAPDEMLQAAFDKAITIRRARQLGVNVPTTLIPDSYDDAVAAIEHIGFPCVIKPRWSNAWNGRRFLPTQAPSYANDGDQLLQILSAHSGETSWPLLQSFVPGQGKGVFALCDRGTVVAWFAHERLRDTKPTGSSSSLRRSIALDERLMEPARKLLADFEWHGPAMVEFRDTGITPPALMEVNGRFWGSLQLAIDSGVDFPALWVSILKGEAIEPVVNFKVGQTLRWFSGDLKRLFFILRGAPAGYVGDFPSASQGLREVFGRQPAGTRNEVLRPNDPLPALGELLGGFRNLIRWRASDHFRGTTLVDFPPKTEHSSRVNNGELAMPDELKPPIILFGNFRSGTTMLQKIIASHPSVVPLYEPVGIWLYADPGRDHDEFDESDATGRVKKYIRGRFLKYQRENENKIIVEKTPANILRIPYVRAIFPEARFIYIVRNPLSFVSSVELKWQRPVATRRIRMRLKTTPLTQLHHYVGRLLKQQWNSRVLKRKYLPIWGPRYRGIQRDLKEDDLLTVIARQWARAAAKAERDLAQFEPGQVLKLRYEDFVDDPLSGLQQICAHCGLEMTTELARQVQDMVKTDRKNKWERFLPGELARIMPELMSEMQRAGYSIPPDIIPAREVA